jgi:5,10-methylenetetrahydrofolate reductase
LRRLAKLGGSTVLVGAPSTGQKVNISLRDAYALRAERTPEVPLGGVAIAERHQQRGDEHERMLSKMDQGCSFFISQAVFSVTASKNLISDLRYACEKADRSPPRLLITLSPCGSLKTLAFMRWLGVEVPRWIENELTHAHDILERSVDLVYENYEQLSDFASRMGVELGCNVESVSTRKAEIEASVELVHRVARTQKTI